MWNLNEFIYLPQQQLPKVLYKKWCSQKIHKIHGEIHMPESLLPEVCNFMKKETQAQVFSCEFWKISKNTFFTEHIQVTDVVAFLRTPMNEWLF